MEERNKFLDAHFRKNYKTLVKRVINRVPYKSHALAEEVVQTAYLNAINHWKAFDPERGSFDAWFNRILNNAANKCLQQENGLISLDDDNYDLDPFIINDDLDIPQNIVLKIQDGIKQQKPEIAEVLHMFFNLGMKTRDIEECTNLPHSTIRSHIRRFRIKWDDENIF